MTQSDDGRSPYDPPQQPQQPDQSRPGAVPGEPSPYQQTPYPQVPQGPVYAQGGQPNPYGVASPPKNNLGVWSLVLGILSVLGCGLFTGIAAIITGSKSRRAQQEGQANNGGMGLAGLILGWIGTVLITLVWVGYLVFIGFVVNSPDLQDSIEQQYELQYEQDLGQGLEQQGVGPALDPRL